MAKQIVSGNSSWQGMFREVNSPVEQRHHEAA